MVLALAPLGVLVVNRRRHNFPSQAVSNYGPTVGSLGALIAHPEHRAKLFYGRNESRIIASGRMRGHHPRYARSETTPEVREVRTRVASYFVRIQVP